MKSAPQPVAPSRGHGCARPHRHVRLPPATRTRSRRPFAGSHGAAGICCRRCSFIWACMSTPPSGMDSCPSDPAPPHLHTSSSGRPHAQHALAFAYFNCCPCRVRVDPSPPARMHPACGRRRPSRGPLASHSCGQQASRVKPPPVQRPQASPGLPWPLASRSLL
uniref:Predicted protein n=2 Tax=Hordeum vulgare subsp. vulgare TaxID=112509 RepID=F2ECV0_HORVV|nr:predicted protein [Hordeum vulgare subsp. vulgare]